ncbi:MAG TPA: hypothetical protein VFI73_07800 [Candidatus Nitrosopolaris sp.]|nr:hypothetical protein [Candidatus Nitrosopolaris sp.]
MQENEAAVAQLSQIGQTPNSRSTSSTNSGGLVSSSFVRPGVSIIAHKNREYMLLCL